MTLARKINSIEENVDRRIRYLEEQPAQQANTGEQAHQQVVAQPEIVVEGVDVEEDSIIEDVNGEIDEM